MAKLFLLCGLPGTGKTTVARRIRELTGAVIVRTDEVRKRIFPRPAYSEDDKRLVYDSVFFIAEGLLKAGRSVVLDGTFYRYALRKKAAAVAERNGAGFSIIHIMCSEGEIARRLRRRRGDLSDANFPVYRRIKRLWEPLTQEHAEIDTGRRWEEEIRQIAGKK